MNERKLKQLFNAVRREPPPAPAAGFDGVVLRAMRREPAGAEPAGAALFEQLNRLCPRLAWAAAVVVGLCFAAELTLSAMLPDLTDGVAQISNQWLFAGTGF